MNGARLTGEFNAPKIQRLVDRELSAIVQNTQKMFTDRVRQKFNEPKTGRRYLIAGRIHIASAPGEAPAKLTGKLNLDIHTAYSRGGTRATIRFGRKYASFLENGTSRMAKRPYAQITLDEISSAFVDHIRQRLASI